MLVHKGNHKYHLLTWRASLDQYWPICLGAPLWISRGRMNLLRSCRRLDWLPWDIRYSKTNIKHVSLETKNQQSSHYHPSPKRNICVLNIAIYMKCPQLIKIDGLLIVENLHHRCFDINKNKALNIANSNYLFLLYHTSLSRPILRYQPPDDKDSFWAWISNYIQHKVLKKLHVHPQTSTVQLFPNFNGAAVGVWE